MKVEQRATNCFQQLNVDANEVEELLIDLILEGKIDGKIDQVNMRLELDKQYAFSSQLGCAPSETLYSQILERRRYTALDRWTGALGRVHGAVVAKASSNGGRDLPEV
jgi:hypothetical protein